MSKELNKAPAEQAGGDERAAFEAWLNEVTYEENTDRGVFMVQRHQTLSVEDERIAWRAWQGRALLARSEQEEAERPVVVAHVVHSNPVVLDQCAQLNANDEMMTVAQHTASVARWAEMFNRVEQERDAALAEVNRLRESKGDPSGSFDRCMRMMYERDENAKRLDAALARVAELERGKVYVEARQCDECQHGGINDSATGVAACHECDWTGPEPEEDRCPGCQRENCMAAACPQCGARYVLVASEEIAAPVAQAQQLNDLDKQCRDDVARALGLRPNQERGFAWSYLLASIKSCVKASGDSAQAQHSVPIAHEFKRALGLVVAALEADGDRPTSKYALSELKKVLAAAPGTEVPQAWLDVQAERRRQITAEGWTPDHDDLYCAAELPRAAAAYILSGANDEAPAIWPFSAKWWKPRDARANYMRAGALILAEIERLDRAAERGKEVGHE